MRGFDNLVPPKSVIIRSGTQTLINAESLVIGDIVRIKGRDKIPADIDY
jgi:magnesium-transporting ATPase (P-type)